ncbi:hypothetical protein ACJX0J_029070 [Zea mays]
MACIDDTRYPKEEVEYGCAFIFISIYYLFALVAELNVCHNFYFENNTAGNRRLCYFIFFGKMEPLEKIEFSPACLETEKGHICEIHNLQKIHHKYMKHDIIKTPTGD